MSPCRAIKEFTARAGTGVLLCGEGQKTATLLEGGTGSRSIQQSMPEFLPDRLEAGTHDMPGIAGLLAGVRFVRRQGLDAICRKERRLAQLVAEEQYVTERST